ncbi:other ulk ulk protein kinase [Moniliophthora roreri]|nr:other ulk ulk protein kinase [Moniliophthora roreri]
MTKRTYILKLMSRDTFLSRTPTLEGNPSVAVWALMRKKGVAPSGSPAFSSLCQRKDQGNSIYWACSQHLLCLCFPVFHYTTPIQSYNPS